MQLGGWWREGRGRAGGHEAPKSSCYGPAAESRMWKMFFQDLWEELVSLAGVLPWHPGVGEFVF